MPLIQRFYSANEMEESIALFWQVFHQTGSVESCIAELKRKGLTQLDTIKVLMEVLAIGVVEADEMVRDSIVWNI